MIRNMKKKLFLILSLIFIFLIVIFFFILKNSKKENNDVDIDIKKVLSSGYIDMNKTENVIIKDGNKYNISKKLSEDHVYKNYKITNISIYTKDGMSCLEFDITNLSFDSDYVEYSANIDFYNNDNIIYYGGGYMVPDIKVNETKHESFNIPYDISNTYNIEFIGL